MFCFVFVGVGGPGGGVGAPGVVLMIVEVVAKPLCTATTIKKPPPGLPKPPGKLVREENLTRAISGGSLIKCRDYN